VIKKETPSLGSELGEKVTNFDSFDKESRMEVFW